MSAAGSNEPRSPLRRLVARLDVDRPGITLRRLVARLDVDRTGITLRRLVARLDVDKTGITLRRLVARLDVDRTGLVQDGTEYSGVIHELVLGWLQSTSPFRDLSSLAEN